jgi:sialic acid synthase SpsE
MAGKDMPMGTIIGKDAIFAMRPRMYAKGFPSDKYEEVIGKKTKVGLKKYDPITRDVFEK